MAAKKLTELVKTYVLQQLAVYNTPLEVVDLVKQEFGVEMSRQNAEYYDPRKNPALSRAYADVFNAARAKYWEDSELHPVDIRLTRQKIRFAAIESSKKNPKVLREIVNDCAKDAGGFFTNKREVTGKDGEPLFAKEHVKQMSEAELEAKLELFAEEFEEKTPATPRPAKKAVPKTATAK